MVYVTILAPETLRCWDFFFSSYYRKRQEGIKVRPGNRLRSSGTGSMSSITCHVLCGQSGAVATAESKAMPRAGPSLPTAWHPAGLRFRAQQRGIRGLTAFTPEIWAINPPLGSAEEWEVLHGKTRELFQPQNLPVLRHLVWPSEAESQGEVPGCK